MLMKKKSSMAFLESFNVHFSALKVPPPPLHTTQEEIMDWSANRYRYTSTWTGTKKSGVSKQCLLGTTLWRSTSNPVSRWAYYGQIVSLCEFAPADGQLAVALHICAVMLERWDSVGTDSPMSSVICIWCTSWSHGHANVNLSHCLETNRIMVALMCPLAVADFCVSSSYPNHRLEIIYCHHCSLCLVSITIDCCQAQVD